MSNGTLDTRILDHLLEGFQVIGFDWRYKYVNDAVVRQSKLSREQLIGFTMPERYPGIESTEMFKTLQNSMVNRASARIENKFTFPDGSEGWFELHVQPIPDGIFILSMEITERKKAELELAYVNERLNDLVFLRTAELEQKNTEIMDSLRYAKEIQQAFLNTRSEIERSFTDSFVMFKPKNVVSGDFFWCRNKENALLLAAGDCTGHGVPGALMSIMGIEKLNAASKKSSDPDVILQKLNKDIKTTLQATSNHLKSNDGMDVALCAISPDRRSLSFAGASRPLWIKRKGASDIQQVKSSIRSIGGYTDLSQRFESTTIDLDPGDAVYLFSDGYADTFGGPSSKKITTRKFRTLLTEISSQAMTDQQHALESYLEEWKGGQEQTDDILVIGIRV